MDNLNRCLAYLEKLPPAIAGSGGHDATLRAACECLRFGLSDSETTEAMNWYNVNRCKPEWKPKEMAHKIADAKRLAVFGERMKPTRRERVVKSFKVAPVRVRVITSTPFAPSKPVSLAAVAQPTAPSVAPPAESWPAVMTFDSLADLRAEGGGPRGEWIWPPGAARPVLAMEDNLWQKQT